MTYRDLSTEQSNCQSEHLDQMTALEIATLMNTLDIQAVDAVRKALPQIAQAAEEAAARMRNGGRLFYVGAGTSGRLGVLDASECPPTFGVPEGLVTGIIAGGDQALRHAIEGAEDDEAQGGEDLKAFALGKQDMVVAISASGTAPYCIGALRYAASVGALPVSLCCNDGAQLSGYAQIAIEMPTGPEVLTGSTRLRAGTATKLALNIISTAAMVRLGKAYGNLMVDVQPTNQKLRDRAARMVMQVCKLDREEAGELLRRAGDSPKRAIVMHQTGAGAEEAKQALEQEDGFIRQAVERIRAGRGL